MRYTVLALSVLAFASWYARRHGAAVYHRHRYARAKCHARPTLARRVRLAGRWVLSLRIRITTGTNARTA